MKKLFSALLACSLMLALLAGCATTPASSSVAPSSQPADSSATGGPIRIAGLKGPTTMGMVKLMQDAENGETKHQYEVEMFGTADEIVPKLVSGEIDIAAIPANLASVLYNKDEQSIHVAAINTLGVLYVVETGDTIHSIADLKGKTIYSTGKGTTPEFALNYILEQNGINPQTDVTIEYKSESTEIAAMLNSGTDAIAVLPQPYVTAVQMQNENIRTALSLTEEWDKVSTGSSLVTGVLVANHDYLIANELQFVDFLDDYKASIEWVNENTAEAAALVAKYGIVEKAPVAEKALPACNIVYMEGAEMQTMLSGYLQVLLDQQPESVGGKLPAEAFYFGRQGVYSDLLPGEE